MLLSVYSPFCCFFYRKKLKVFRWKENHNILLLKEVISLEPYKFNKGSKERGQAWDKIAKNLNSIPNSGLNTTQRGVRTQYEKLMDEFHKKENKDKAASGIDSDYNEIDQLLNDVYEKATEAAEQMAEEAEEKEKAAIEEKKQIDDIRTKAMEKQGERQTCKRKSTVLKEVLEDGRKVKNEIELKRIALEEQRIIVDQERNTFFEKVVSQQQEQQSLLVGQQAQAQKEQQMFQQQQQKFMAELQLQNSQVQLELLKVLKDMKDK